MKTCSKCGKQKSSDNFYKSKATKDGLCGYCKQCSKEYLSKWRGYNEEKIKKYQEKYQEKNKEKINTQRRNYRKKNKDKISNYRKENKAKISNYYKKYIRTAAIYSTYKDRLTMDESPKLADDGVSLKVKCRYCGKYFIPTAIQCNKRIQALNGQVYGLPYKSWMN